MMRVSQGLRNMREGEVIHLVDSMTFRLCMCDTYHLLICAPPGYFGACFYRKLYNPYCEIIQSSE